MACRVCKVGIMTPQQAIEVALIAAGYTKRKDQADILGEHPSHWRRYLTMRSPQACKVLGWLTAMEAKGIAVELRWTWEGVRLS